MAASKHKRRGVNAADLLEKGLKAHREGDVVSAERCYVEASRLAPSNATALYLRSVVAMGARRHSQAAALLRRATRLDTANVVYWVNLGEAERRSGRHDEALAALSQAVALQPSLAMAHFNLGLVHRDAHRFAEASFAFERAASLDLTLPGLAYELVNACKCAGREDVAISTYERIRAHVPDDLALRLLVADIYIRNNLLDEAAEHAERALELDPTKPEVHTTYALALAERGELDRALEHYRKACALDSKNRVAHGNLLFMLAFHPDVDGTMIHSEARRFAELHLASVIPAVFHPPLQPRTRLRVGYVSPDFRQHAIAHFLLPLIQRHDRQRVDVVCYANVEHPDGITTAFRDSSDEWRDIWGASDDDVVQRIREDEIDVLVDVAMHTADNRIMLFAKRAAPVQVSYLAYLGTTGVPAMDYRLTAPGLDPDPAEQYYTERSVSLSTTYFCYDPLATTPVVGSLPAQQTGTITFGSLNAFRKVNEFTLKAWAAVLRAIPSSRLLLHASAGRAEDWVRSVLQERGVAGERIHFEGRMNREAYLATYHRIDVCLDTFPYNGGTTTLDAFWMGVPVLGLTGRTAVSRVGLSLGRLVGLADLFAPTTEQLVARAIALTADLGRLAALRRELRPRLEASPLMDATTFARDVESAYWMMWNEWCSRA